MKKFWRNLLSGYFLVLLILLIELAIFIFMQFFLDNVVEIILSNINIGDDKADLVKIIVSLTYLAARTIIFVVAVIIFFKIINKPEDPEFKIPWIVGMLLLPFFCSVLFLIFGNHGLRKKDRYIVENTKLRFQPYFEDNDKTLIEYSDKLGHAVGTFKYLNNTTNLAINTNCRCTYYKCGEEFFPAFIEGLKQAEKFIFIEFFIITDGKEWSAVQEVLVQKAAEGVDVRIVYDDMGCSGTISPKTPKLMKQKGIKCYKFHPFRPILSGVYNNRDHRKIVVVDHKMAFTGGINLADEYANEIERFGYWKDTMIKIEGSAVNNLITIFLQNLNLCVGHLSNYDKFLNHEYEKYDDEGFVMPFGDGPGDIDEALIGEQTYINILNYAKKRVDISTPYLVPTYSLIDALRNAALRGVEVNLILPGIPDKKLVYSLAKSNFRYLLDAGVNIYIYTPGFNHMKSAIADGELAFVGTINFDFRSLVHHFECGTVLYKCKCLKEIQEDFDQMLSVSQKVPKDFKLRGAQKGICNLLKIISPLF